MCSIIGAFKKEKLKELININQYRGNFSFSYTEVDKNGPSIQVKGWGKFPEKIITNSPLYKIAHVQAPTGGLKKEFSRIHPTQVENTFLWHNGILTRKGINFLQRQLGTSEDFDTLLLHKAIYNFGFSILSEIEGLFSCIYLNNNKIFLFRTKHGKLYIDDEKNISSERFENSKCINYDTIYDINMDKIDTFKTKRFSYVIKGEI
jgi:hypothetical protein